MRGMITKGKRNVNYGQKLLGLLFASGIFIWTQFALDAHANKLDPPFWREHPGAILKGGIVPHMLAVTAFELGNPFAALILVKPGNLAFHRIFKLHVEERGSLYAP